MAAKGHPLQCMPERREEFLGIDVMAFAHQLAVDVSGRYDRAGEQPTRGTDRVLVVEGAEYSEPAAGRLLLPINSRRRSLVGQGCRRQSSRAMPIADRVGFERRDSDGRRISKSGRDISVRILQVVAAEHQYRTIRTVLRTSWRNCNRGTRSQPRGRISARASRWTPPSSRFTWIRCAMGEAARTTISPSRFLRAYIPDEESARYLPGRWFAGCPGEIRGQLGRLQHGHAVRRRQDPRTDAALPSGEQRAEGERVDGRRANPRNGRRARCPRGRPPPCLWAPSSTRSRAGAATTARPFGKTPWGEIACQLGRRGGASQVVAEHDRRSTAPAGDVIRRFLPADRPVSDPDGRVAELRQPEPQERAFAASSTTSSKTCRRRPAARGQRRARRVDPGIRDWR